MDTASVTETRQKQTTYSRRIARCRADSRTVLCEARMSQGQSRAAERQRTLPVQRDSSVSIVTKLRLDRFRFSTQTINFSFSETSGLTVGPTQIPRIPISGGPSLSLNRLTRRFAPPPPVLHPVQSSRMRWVLPLLPPPTIPHPHHNVPSWYGT